MEPSASQLSSINQRLCASQNFLTAFKSNGFPRVWAAITAFVFSDRKQIKEEDIRFESIAENDVFLPYKEAVNSFKREYIEMALDECHWNQTLTAKKLKLQRTYLARLIKELDINKI